VVVENREDTEPVRLRIFKVITVAQSTTALAAATGKEDAIHNAALTLQQNSYTGGKGEGGNNYQ